jgi:polyisoprenoid-binding protein YceI
MMEGLMRFAVVAVASVALSAVAHAQAGESLSVATAESSLTYHLIHKMHKVHGTSKKVEGKAVITPDGKAQVMVRVPVESFDSENTNRDAHMKEAVEAARYPYVELKAVADGMTAPTSFPSSTKKTFKAQLVFHGVKQIFDIPVDITWKSAGVVEATADFKISLESYKVERPSLLFVKVDDELGLTAKLTFKK